MFWLLQRQLNVTSMPWCNGCRSNCAKWAKFPAWRGTMVLVASKDPVCKYIAPEAQAHAAWQERTCLVPDQKNSEGESITALGTSKYLRTSARWRSAITLLALAAVAVRFRRPNWRIVPRCSQLCWGSKSWGLQLDVPQLWVTCTGAG